MKFILGSSSVCRRELLCEIGLPADEFISPDVDESPIKKEKPKDLAMRLSKLKNDAIIEKLKDGGEEVIILTADTVVGVGNKPLDKALTDDDVRKYMKILSGRGNRVYTGFCCTRLSADGTVAQQVHNYGETRIKFKTFSKNDIDEMVASKSGIGVAGGYTIDGFASSLMINAIGSMSNIQGLPLYQVRNQAKTED
ncbi:Maf family protein [Rickettsiales bacterium]|nr:Maf family protein [Rickettsiales bacterium]